MSGPFVDELTTDREWTKRRTSTVKRPSSILGSCWRGEAGVEIGDEVQEEEL